MRSHYLIFASFILNFCLVSLWCTIFCFFYDLLISWFFTPIYVFTIYYYLQAKRSKCKFYACSRASVGESGVHASVSASEHSGRLVCVHIGERRVRAGLPDGLTWGRTWWTLDVVPDVADVPEACAPRPWGAWSTSGAMSTAGVDDWHG